MKDLNILIEGFVRGSDPSLLQTALKPLKLRRCVFVLRTGEIPPLLLAEKQEVLYHNLLANTDWNMISPLDEELIERMRHCETVCFEMMGRDECHGRFLPYQKRKLIYLQLLRYWNHILMEKDITLFLSVCIPHISHSYVIYELCKLKGISTLFFHHVAPFRGVFHLMQDFHNPVPALTPNLEELRSSERSGMGNLPEKFAAYLREHTEGGQKASIPWYMHKSPERRFSRWCTTAGRILVHHPLMFLKRTTKFLVRRSSIRYWCHSLRERLLYRQAASMFRFYDAQAVTPDFSRRYVYIPLQEQPEAALCPMAGAYMDQLLIVQMLSALVPADVLLYVKEPPHQRHDFPTGCGRSFAFYKDLLACRNVRFISLDENSYRLMEHSSCIATGTGTAGFEALFRGKPVLLFGYRYYQYAPGVFRVSIVEDCKRALHAIFVEGFRPALKEVRLFLQALTDSSIQGFLCDDLRQAPSVSEDRGEENTKYLAHSLQEEIRSLMGGSTSVTHKALSPVSPVHS